MAEVKQIVFNYKELAETLVRKADIHEGHWGVILKFGIHGANITTSESSLIPAAIVPVLEIGIQKFQDANNLTVDAAEVNPAVPKPNTQPREKPVRRSIRF